MMPKPFFERLRGWLSSRRNEAASPAAAREEARIPPRFEPADPLPATPCEPEPVASLQSSNVDADLLRSARACQIDAALGALARGANPNTVPDSTDRDQRSVVVLACLAPDLRLLRELIAKGADVDRAHAGLPPLIAATRDSYQGRPDAVMILLANGADPRCADGDGNTPLHYAARAAQAAVAALLCDSGAPIDAVNGEGQTALAIAAAAGNRDVVRFLLENRADPQVPDAQPALVAAAASADDDPESVKLLLRHRADVDARDALGRTALMTAALYGNADIAAQLLKAGARIDSADERGTTALMEAARAGALDVLDVLAEHAPNPELTDALGRTALMLAAQSAQIDEGGVRRLLELGASASRTTGEGKRAADFAAAAGRWNIVAALDADYVLPASVDVRSATRTGSPAHLLDALRFAHWHIVDGYAAQWRAWHPAQRAQLFVELGDHADARARIWLLDHGLIPDAALIGANDPLPALLARLPDTRAAVGEWLAAGAPAGGTGLLEPVFAAMYRDPSAGAELEALAATMLERGADPFAIDGNGQTALAHAVALGSEVLAQALLERGADPNARDRHGRTPLFAALGLPPDRAVALTRHLIRHGADPEIAAANGETPLGLSLAKPQSPLREWLDWAPWRLPKRALRPADLPAAAALGDAAAIGKLLELGLPLDALDAQGASALLRAAGAGHAEVVAMLLERGAQADFSAPGGATPLAAAVSARREKVVETLLERGVAVDQRLSGGGTALMVAAALGYPEIVAVLLAHGASVDAQSERGARALHAAAQFAFDSRDTARARRTLEALIGKRAALDAVDAEGRTALHYLLGVRAKPGSAADQRHLQALLSLFLVGRADVNVQDERGISPLHACAMHGLLLPARALLVARADAEARDALGRTPREVASLLGHVDVATELSVRAPGAMPVPGRPAAESGRLMS